MHAKYFTVSTAALSGLNHIDTVAILRPLLEHYIDGSSAIFDIHGFKPESGTVFSDTEYILLYEEIQTYLIEIKIRLLNKN